MSLPRLGVRDPDLCAADEDVEGIEGRLAAIVDARERRTDYEHDAAGRRRVRRFADGSQYETEYDRSDRRVVLEAVLGESGQQNAYYLQSSNRDGVHRCVGTAAGLVKEHYGLVLRGDPITLERVKVISSKRNEEYTRKLLQQPIRESAERAWHAKDFVMVAQCYGSIRKDLTPTEQRRLEYAEKQLSR